MKFKDGQTVWVYINGIAFKDKVIVSSRQNLQDWCQLDKLDKCVLKSECYKTKNDSIYFNTVTNK